MADLVQEIEAQIAGAKAAAARQRVGVIREIGDGVAKVEGLGDVMLNEMLDFGHGITGLALNLDETEVGVIILGDYTQLAGRRRGPRDRASCCRCRSARACSAASSTRSASRSTARARSRATSPIRSRSSRPASSGAVRSASRCRPASCRSTR